MNDLETLAMTDQTRREFLAAAGALASTSFAVRGRSAGDAARGRARRRSPSAIPPHRPLAVEGIHAYTDRVSVAAGDTVRFHVSSSYPYELQVCRLGTDVDSPARDELLHSFGPSPAAVQPIHPGSYLIVDKPLDAATRSAGPDARGLDQALAHDRAPGDHRPVRPAASLRFRFVRQRGRVAELLSRRRRRLRRVEPAHDASRPTSDGSQSARAHALSRTTRPARCSPTNGIM